MNPGHALIAVMPFALIVIMSVWLSSLVEEARLQTVALQRQANALERMAADSNHTVSIQVQGFSPEAQKVFTEALTAKKKERK